jgi:hypothetical protein
MKHTLILIVLLGPLFAGLASPPAVAQQLSFVDLVERLTDLEALAVLPEPGERNAMWSSYDRASRYDADTGLYVEWYANGDGTGLIREEDGNQVIAEMDGPGVIWRIWSARPEAGHVKILIDGQAAVDMPFAHYFDAQHAPFDYATLGYESGRGMNLYFPIPYQRSCKVIAEPGWGRYYQITYTTFPPETQLPAMQDATSPEAVAALKQADRYFAENLGSDPAGERPGEATLRKRLTVAAGQTQEIARLEGPQAITALRVRADFGDRQQQIQALRKLVLRITWDDQSAPAVWCPLGDFFGTAPGVNLYRSLPAGMTEDGWYSLWYMPFAKQARIELVNEDDRPRQMDVQITHAPLSRPADQLGRLHVKWHRGLEPVRSDRWPDWTVVQTRGRGRFCGMMLHVWNPRGGQCQDVVWCRGHYWWGEGDEKFFVDGEPFPSTFGTGTEDYFGYAWGCGDLFQRPFHNQTMTEGNAGHQSVNRFQIADNVPFQSSFDGCLEKYFPDEQPTLYAVTAWWYLSADGEDPRGPVPADQRDGYYHRPPLVCGGYEVLGPVPGTVRTQGLRNYQDHRWDNDDQLWWTGAQPGDKLDIRIPVAQAGTYAITAYLTKARDYGIVQLYLDGQKLGEAIDLYHAAVIPSGPIVLGTRELSAGDHTLTVEIVGANPQALKAYMFGLDRLVLTSAQDTAAGSR